MTDFKIPSDGAVLVTKDKPMTNEQRLESYESRKGKPVVQVFSDADRKGNRLMMLSKLISAIVKREENRE